MNNEYEEWYSVDLEELNIGDYVKGETFTNSQRYGEEFNYEIEGILHEKHDTLYNCIILDSDNNEVPLCRDVGTSGGNSVYKKK